jgi:hypothetical protein
MQTSEDREAAKRYIEVCTGCKSSPLSSGSTSLTHLILHQFSREVRKTHGFPVPSNGDGGHIQEQPVLDPVIAVQENLYSPSNLNVLGMLVSPKCHWVQWSSLCVRYTLEVGTGCCMGLFS